MKYFLTIGLWIGMTLVTTPLISQTVFTSLEDVLAYSETTNLDVVANNIQLESSKKLERVSKIGRFDPKIQFPITYTNNTTVPVNLLPAEAFGGEPGTFREVQFGQQYNLNFTQSLEVSLYNPVGWMDYSLAKLNTKITENNSRLTIQQLHQSIADNYYHIINLQKQQASAEKNLQTADSLLIITKNKYDNGLARQQEVNNAQVNRLTLAQQLDQIAYSMTDAYYNLKVLLHLPDSETVEINEVPPTDATIPMAAPNPLMRSNLLLQQEYAQQDYLKTQKAFLPTVSFVAGNTFQANGNDFYAVNGDWLTNNYLGVRVGFNLPNKQTLTNREVAKLNKELADNNFRKNQATLAAEAEKLNNNYQKAIAQYESTLKIGTINRDSYDKNVNLYREGLVDLSVVLDSYTAVVNSDYNENSAWSQVQLAKAKIFINNKSY
ncbi:MAG: TolC family protein [Bacteroidota bacterium]